MRLLVLFLAPVMLALQLERVVADSGRPPNVVLILTDDQGWGDVGFHGNPHLKTPNLDRLANESVELARFYVSPVCSPTRASLLTGRYNYRTGAIDTFLGRSTMAADETTLAEIMSASGYRTGIFGKWHLGDNYPSRPIDQGFQRALVHRGGGIGQPADPPGNTYFDPVLLDNGREVTSRGYSSDVFTDAAISFVREHSAEPFLAYLAFNCPHAPLQVPSKYHDPYRGMSLDDDTAKLYGMVANIDDNVGRLLVALDELGLAAETIVIFLTDNGPQVLRYNGTLRGQKGSVYDGGIRVPCLVRWPGKLKAGRKVETVAAHIDLLPTLVELCRLKLPADIRFDGVSLAPLLLGQRDALDERLLFFQWHRGDVPERYRNCAVRSARYKLLQPVGREPGAFTAAWALYDMLEDPREDHDVADAHPDVVARMKAAYEAWFTDVGSTRGYPVPRIIVGTEHENPVTLTRQDWRGPRAGWGKDSLGFWKIEVAQAGSYDVSLRLPASQQDRVARLRIGSVERIAPLAAGADRIVFPSIGLPEGRARVETSVEGAGTTIGAHYVELTSRDRPSR